MISDFSLLDQVLSAIEHTTQMAVLHRERDVAQHSVTSDVDLCVADDPLRVLASIEPGLVEEGVFPVLVFHYDRRSYTFFFLRQNARDGAQVDLLNDTAGRGRYGIRTDVLLGSSVSGTRWPRISGLDEALYVLRKRQVKGDADGIRQALGELSTWDRSDVTHRADQVFSRGGASAVVDLLSRDHIRLRRTTGLWRSRLMRPERWRRRCGYWAHFTGPAASAAAEEISAGLSQVLVRSVAPRNAHPLLILNHLLRPHLIATTEVPRVWPRPDVTLNVNCAPDAASFRENLVHSMHRGVVRRYKLDSRRR